MCFLLLFVLVVVGAAVGEEPGVNDIAAIPRVSCFGGRVNVRLVSLLPFAGSLAWVGKENETACSLPIPPNSTRVQYTAPITL